MGAFFQEATRWIHKLHILSLKFRTNSWGSYLTTQKGWGPHVFLSISNSCPLVKVTESRLLSTSHLVPLPTTTSVPEQHFPSPILWFLYSLIHLDIGSLNLLDCFYTLASYFFSSLLSFPSFSQFSVQSGLFQMLYVPHIYNNPFHPP